MGGEVVIALREFLAMGGHGAYVWSAWALGVLVLGWNFAAALRAKRRAVGDVRGEDGNPPLERGEGGRVNS